MTTLVVTVIVGLIMIIAYLFFSKEQKIIRQNELEKRNTVLNFFQKEINCMGNLEILGIGCDGNSDVEFIQAVKKITLPDNIRIQIYD